jgi:hypothetical protein
MDNRSLSDVRVLITGPMNDERNTNASGKISLSNLTFGEYRILIKKSKYYPSNITVNINEKNLGPKIKVNLTKAPKNKALPGFDGPSFIIMICLATIILISKHQRNRG